MRKRTGSRKGRRIKAAHSKVPIKDNAKTHQRHIKDTYHHGPNYRIRLHLPRTRHWRSA